MVTTVVSFSLTCPSGKLLVGMPNFWMSSTDMVVRPVKPNPNKEKRQGSNKNSKYLI